MFDLIPTVSAVAIVAIFFAAILFVLFVALPFAVFGIKPLLRQMIQRMDLMNDRLGSLEKAIADQQNEDKAIEIESGPRQVVSSRK